MESCSSAATFWKKLPQGLDTVIGTEGPISPAARPAHRPGPAILKDAPIVVLDEATAFADPEDEALIQKTFARLTKGRTVIMIAHRLSTVVGADKILVPGGRPGGEQGTHGALIAARWTVHPDVGRLQSGDSGGNGKRQGGTVMFQTNFQRKYALTDQGVQNTKREPSGR